MRPPLRAALLGGLRALAVLVVAILLAAADWPMYMHDVQRSGANAAETALSPAAAAHLTRSWVYRTGGAVATAPAIVGGVVYIGSWDGYEYALDAATGRLRWKTYHGITTPAALCHAAPLGVTSSAAVRDGVVYVGGDAYWYALSAATGAVLWKVYTGDNSANGGHYNWASPLLYGGYAYVGVSSFGDCPLVQGQLLQVDLATHQIVRSFDVVPTGQRGGGLWTSPSVDPRTNTLYVTTGTASRSPITTQPLAEAVVALDATTLAVKGAWQLPQEQTGLVTDADWGGTPLPIGGVAGAPLVAAVNKNGLVIAFQRAALGAGPVWQRRLAVGGWCPQCGDGSISSGAYGGGVLYAAGGATSLDASGRGRGQGPLFADSFAGDPLGGAPRRWQAVNGRWRVVATGRGRRGRAVRPAPGIGHGARELATGSARWRDYTLTVGVEAPAASGSVGVMVRRRDAANGYQFRLMQGNRWALGARIRGVFHPLKAGSFTYHARAWYTVRLTAVGTRLWASVNGVTLAALTDRTFRRGGISLRTDTRPSYGAVRVSRAYRGAVRALNPATGAVLWERPAPGPVLGALAYAPGLIVDGAGATLEVRAAATGARLYQYRTGGPLYGAPGVADGRIFVGSTDGNVYAFGLPRAARPRRPCARSRTCPAARRPSGLSNRGTGWRARTGLRSLAQPLRPITLSSASPVLKKCQRASARRANHRQPRPSTGGARWYHVREGGVTQPQPQPRPATSFNRQRDLMHDADTSHGQRCALAEGSIVPSILVRTDISANTGHPTRIATRASGCRIDLLQNVPRAPEPY